MSQNLSRLVYYSRNRISGTPDDMDAAISQILTSSRRNNPGMQVTGALMFNGGCFAQVLEGPIANVEKVFERIQQDERHTDVMLLSFGPVSRRAFVHWSMAYVGAKPVGGLHHGDAAEISGFDPASMNGDALFETLYQLVLEEEATTP